jgi:hypothetical protein
MHHRAYDTGQLELLPHLEPCWRTEVAHAVLHLGLVRDVPTAAPLAAVMTGDATARRQPRRQTP